MNNTPIKVWFASLALGCFGLVAFGLQLQAAYHLSPCPLCIFQRLLYLAIGTISLLGWLFPCRWFAFRSLIVASATGGILVAGYQTWLQLFPKSAHGCGISEPSLIERLVDYLGTVYPDLFLATGFCSSKEWVLVGLSMANLSLLIFTGIAALSYVLLRPVRS